MKIFAQSNNVVRADPIHNRRDSSAVVRILNLGGLILFLDFYGNGIFLENCTSNREKLEVSTDQIEGPIKVPIRTNNCSVESYRNKLEDINLFPNFDFQPRSLLNLVSILIHVVFLPR